ncbi:MAG: DUF1294 domain-containing protein [Helicobacteraceae bacterium]|nr:DUF1294 domain-containing protein [Helicobacteraceae bacterium]
MRELLLYYSLIYLLLINIFTFLLFGIDKFKAFRKKKVRRISEFALLSFSFFGGSVGSLLAIFYFRHKISKRSFLLKFISIVIAQFAIFYLFSII